MLLLVNGLQCIVLICFITRAQGTIFNLLDANQYQLLHDVVENVASASDILDIRNDNGITPLMYAVLQGKKAGVEILLKAGADPLVEGTDGYSPLHGAAFQGFADIARLLIDEYKVNPSIMHSDGYTPIHRACWGSTPGHADTVKVFIEAGINVKEERSGQGYICEEMTENSGIKSILNAM